MQNAGYIALSHASALSRQLEIVANNIANTNTPTYKAERLLFTEYLANLNNGGGLSYVQDIGVARDVSEGPMAKTGNDLDIAISGPGFFVMQTPEGERFTRHGRLQIDELGRLANSEGNPILGESGEPILVGPDATTIEISQDGVVSTNAEQVGRLKLVQFDNEQFLRREANGLYVTRGAQPQPVTDIAVLQGMTEGSNVKPVLEMTRMIEILRSYQSTQRLMQTMHEQQRGAIQKLSQSPNN